tara:strand:+ start:301 stop:564 length:264 start_codon:yes stop_codon:yes gene_type:complete
MDKVNLDKISRLPINGFIGRRVDGSSIVKVCIGEHNPKLKALMIDSNPDSINDSWDKFCDLLPNEMDPRGEVYIDWLFVDGKPRVFH